MDLLSVSIVELPFGMGRLIIPAIANHGLILATFLFSAAYLTHRIQSR